MLILKFNLYIWQVDIIVDVCIPATYEIVWHQEYYKPWVEVTLKMASNDNNVGSKVPVIEEIGRKPVLAAVDRQNKIRIRNGTDSESVGIDHQLM